MSDIGQSWKAKDSLVFLCHSSDDKEYARSLYTWLCLDGVNCWLDDVDLLPGKDWDLEISGAIRRSKFVLACLSNASIAKSGYVQKELKKALDVADEQPEGVAYLIPVRLEECEIPERLKRWQCVDLFREGGYKRLIRGLGIDPQGNPVFEPDPPDVVKYIADVHSRVLLLAESAIGDQLTTVRTEDEIDSSNFLTIMAPGQGLQSEFALKVAWEQEESRLAHQAKAAQYWMRNHGLPGIIVTRQHFKKRIRRYLELDESGPQFQALVWRGPDDDEALKLCLRRITSLER